jgi:hypothetical protein
MSRSDATARARQAGAKIWDPAERQVAAEITGAGEEEMRRYLAERDAQIPPIENRKKALTELRRLYLQERTLERVAPDLLLALEELAERRPNWVTSYQRRQWEQADGRTLLDDYLRLAEYEVKAEQLRRCRLDFDSNLPDFEAKVDSRFDAVHVAMSGKVGEDAAQTRKMAQALGQADLKKLHESLAVALRCRFFPEAHPKDPNAQWFGAQRVSCQAKGVASITVHGRLDPERDDRVDWWTLDDYDDARVFFRAEEAPEFHVDPPFRDRQQVRLRVVATGDEPATYTLTFRPRKKRDGLSVVIHESPASADAAFPY